MTASPAVTPSLMPTPTVSQATPYISSPASATEATSNPPAHLPGAPTEEPVHVSGTRFAIHLCANSTLIRIMGRLHDDIFSDPNSPTGLNRGINFLQVTLEHDHHLTNYFEEWTRRFNDESDPGDPGSVFRCTLLPFLVSYSRLVMCSFGFQHAFNEAWRRVTMSCLTSASPPQS